MKRPNLAFSFAKGTAMDALMTHVGIRLASAFA